MATILFSALIHNQTIAFDPLADVLSFDNAGLSAGQISLDYAADYTWNRFTLSGKTIFFGNAVNLAQLTTGNVIFANGSRLLVGDNTIGTVGDDSANTLIDTTESGYLLGLGGDDSLTGSAGADVLDGGSGADTLVGGIGNDTYLIDNIGDVVSETPTVVHVLVSTDATGVQGNGWSSDPALSANDRYVVFESDASNLVTGDTSMRDIFVKDLLTGAIQCVSTDAAGVQGNSSSYDPAISSDGHYAAFASHASNLVPGDTNIPDIFVKDLLTGAIQRVSTDATGVQGNRWSYSPAISDDGRYVAFASDADNLVAGDTNTKRDIFVRDMQTGSIQRVSTGTGGTQGNGGSDYPAFSADGRYVVFDSFSSNLVGDTNGHTDIFLKDLQTGAIQRISTDIADVQGNGSSYNATISGNGRYVVFMSSASNLVAGDANGNTDIFIKDLQTGTIQCASSDATGAHGNGPSLNATISADGRYVAFESYASNLVVGDTNAFPDIFVKDLLIGGILRASTDVTGAQGNARSFNASFSADGSYLVFQSGASNLVADSNGGTSDIFRVLNPFLAGGGIDTVQTSIPYTLTGNVDNLTLLGGGHLNGTGNNLNNMLTGNAGNNVLDGGAGTDTVNFANATAGVLANLAAGTATGFGTDTLLNIENLLGSAFDDHFIGDSGNNSLDGGPGMDTVSYVNAIAAVTANLATGIAIGFGNDALLNIENLLGSSYNDNFTGSVANNVFDGGAGYDIVSYANATVGVTANLATGIANGFGVDTLLNIEHLIGSAFNDIITGTSVGNYISGGMGMDTMSYANATGPVYVNLALTAVQANGYGADTLLSIENLIGSAYNDGFTGTNGNNVFDGGNGLDTVVYANATAAVTVDLAAGTASGFGNDTLISIEHLIGSDHNDVLTGTSGNNYLNGGAGYDAVSYANATVGITINLALSTAQNTGFGTDTLLNVEHLTGSAYDDLVLGTRGTNYINGNGGFDTVQYINVGGANVDLALTVAQNTGGGGVDTLRNIEGLIGTNYNDTLKGDAGNNRLDGYAGNDSLIGNGGDDLLRGGGGNDTLTGGTGLDIFRFDVAPNAATNLDTITDFNAADDTIELENAVFAKLATTGVLAAGNLSTTGVATDADDYVVYNSTTGALYYDADGNGGGAAVQFALLGTTVHPTITAADFVVT